MIARLISITALFLFLSPAPLAQNTWLDHWEHRVDKTQNEQPNWITPVVTSTARLEQKVRLDFVRQINNQGNETWNYGNGKGFEFIATRRLEIDINVPPYFQHSQPKTLDGFGDESFQTKFRFLSRDAESGNFVITGFLTGSIPTGSHANGSTSAAVTPTLAAGKGFGHFFDVQSTLAANLPIEHVSKLGRPVTWNVAFQGRLARYLWPQVEFNNTYYHGGANDGRVQSFITPGLLAGRLPLHGRTSLIVGSGFQIAESSFHTYNHSLVYVTRLSF